MTARHGSHNASMIMAAAAAQIAAADTATSRHTPTDHHGPAVKAAAAAVALPLPPPLPPPPSTTPSRLAVSGHDGTDDGCRWAAAATADGCFGGGGDTMTVAPSTTTSLWEEGCRGADAGGRRGRDGKGASIRRRHFPASWVAPVASWAASARRLLGRPLAAGILAPVYTPPACALPQTAHPCAPSRRRSSVTSLPTKNIGPPRPIGADTRCHPSWRRCGGGVRSRWQCAPSLMTAEGPVPPSHGSQAKNAPAGRQQGTSERVPTNSHRRERDPARYDIDPQPGVPPSTLTSLKSQTSMKNTSKSVM